MKVLVIGGGAREHAIAWKLSLSDKVEEIFCAPGNGGTAVEKKCTNIPIAADNTKMLIEFAKENNIDITIVGPEVPLIIGIVDEFKKEGLKIFGPDSRAARLEGSKAFAKEFMNKYSIKTAEHKCFYNALEAKEYIYRCTFPIVIKADGLAQGKGVAICEDMSQALETVESYMEKDVFKGSGSTIVVEEYLQGVEASILCILDGKKIVPFISAMDHKRILEGNEGDNTGGMGAIAPNPHFTEKHMDEFVKNVMQPTMEGIKEEGWEYHGILFFGLMLCKNGVYLLEYNVRMGDPETQALLCMLENDLCDLVEDAVKGELKEKELKWKDGYCCCVVAASGGYPLKYNTGYEIIKGSLYNSKLFIAGAEEIDGRLITSGGRVLSVVAVGENIEEARRLAYEDINNVSFTNMYYRRDIGKL